MCCGTLCRKKYGMSIPVHWQPIQNDWATLMQPMAMHVTTWTQKQGGRVGLDVGETEKQGRGTGIWGDRKIGGLDTGMTEKHVEVGLEFWGEENWGSGLER